MDKIRKLVISSIKCYHKDLKEDWFKGKSTTKLMAYVHPSDKIDIEKERIRIKMEIVRKNKGQTQLELE